MINTIKLLEAINNRVMRWAWIDNYSTEYEAKKQAAALFITMKGVRVERTLNGEFAVLAWRLFDETTK